ncbi:MAG: class I SAM-dependent methyltransferase [Chloroflexi bacterium]|nr:MAG: class I SAM-dependent methyltransferase [Chloroflexota bacterium]
MAGSGPPIDETAVGQRYADWFSRGLRGIGMRYVFSRRGLWVINTPYRRILAAAHIGPQDHVLDLGCGIGNILIALAEQIAFARPPIGVDVSPALIDIGRGEIRKAGLDQKIELRAAPATRLPFDDASFDVVLTSHVIKHLDDEALAACFHEVARLLGPGGRFLMWEFKKSPLSAPLFISARATGLPPPFTLRSEPTLRSALTQAGFARVNRVPTGWFIAPPVPRIALLATR